MSHRVAFWAGWVAIGALGSCSRHEEPPPPNNSVLTARTGEALPPIVLRRPNYEALPPVTPSRVLPKLEGRAAVESPSGADGADASHAIVLNDADVESLATQLAEFLSTENIDGLVAAMVPEQQGVFQKAMSALKQMQANVKRLEDALREKAPDELEKFQAQTSGAMAGPLGELGGKAKAEITDVTPDGEDKATGTLKVEGQPDETIEFARVDGKWRAKLPGFEAPSSEKTEMFTAMMEGFARATGEIAEKIESGALDPKDVGAEFAKAMMSAGELAAAAADGQGTPSGPIALNDGDAQSLADQFLQFRIDHNIAGLVAMTVPDQQEIVGLLLPLHYQFNATLERIAELMRAKGYIGTIAVPSFHKELNKPQGSSFAALADASYSPLIELKQFTMEDDNRASAKLTIEGQDGFAPYEFERVDGKWRLRLYEYVAPSPEQLPLALAKIRAAVKGVTDVADRLERDEIAPDDAMGEVFTVVDQARQITAPPDANAPAEPPPSDAATGDVPPDTTDARPVERPRRTLSGRDVDNEVPTAEELLGRQ